MNCYLSIRTMYCSHLPSTPLFVQLTVVRNCTKILFETHTLVRAERQARRYDHRSVTVGLSYSLCGHALDELGHNPVSVSTINYLRNQLFSRRLKISRFINPNVST
jgi:hypothetical protein